MRPCLEYWWVLIYGWVSVPNPMVLCWRVARMLARIICPPVRWGGATWSTVPSTRLKAIALASVVDMDPIRAYQARVSRLPQPYWAAATAAAAPVRPPSPQSGGWYRDPQYNRPATGSGEFASWSHPGGHWSLSRFWQAERVGKDAGGPADWWGRKQAIPFEGNEKDFETILKRLNR